MFCLLPAHTGSPESHRASSSHSLWWQRVLRFNRTAAGEEKLFLLEIETLTFKSHFLTSLFGMTRPTLHTEQKEAAQSWVGVG